MKTPAISIVIPNWNGKKHLAGCLPTLERQTFRDFETIMVDNGSQDGSVKFLRENFPGVRVIAWEKNRGFSAAVNEGIRAAQGAAVILLNNDTETDPRWLEALAAAATNHPDVDCFASKILCLPDRAMVDSAGDGYSLRGVAWNIGKGHADSSEFSHPAWVFSAPGAGAFYRKRYFDEVGLFDEDLFAFYEDVDLGFRGQLRGKKCLYVPSAVVYHRGGGTVAHHSPLNLHYCSRNALLVLAKNMPARLLIKNMHWLVFTYARHFARHLLKRGHRRSILTGYGSALASLPRALAKRKAIQRGRLLSDAELESMLHAHEKQRLTSRSQLKAHAAGKSA